MAEDPLDLLKRGAIGLLEIPMTPFAVYTAPKNLVDAATGRNDSIGLPFHDTINRGVTAYDQFLRDQFGVTKPETTAQFAAEIIPQAFAAPVKSAVEAAAPLGPVVQDTVRMLLPGSDRMIGKIGDAAVGTGIGAIVANTMPSEAKAAAPQIDEASLTPIAAPQVDETSLKPLNPGPLQVSNDEALRVKQEIEPPNESVFSSVARMASDFVQSPEGQAALGVAGAGAAVLGGAGAIGAHKLRKIAQANANPSIIGDLPQTPYAGALRTGLDTIVSSVQNAKAPLKTLIRETSTQPKEDLAVIDTMASEIAARQRFDTFMRNGQFPGSQVSMTPLQQHIDYVTRLSPEDQEWYKVARAAATEMDNRMRNFQSAMASGTTPPAQAGQVSPYAVNFRDIGDAAFPGGSLTVNGRTFDKLDDVVQIARSRPEVANALLDAKAMQTRGLDYLVDQGMISAKNKHEFLMRNPNHLVSLDPDGTIDPLTTRRIDPGSGVDKFQDPIALDEEYFMKIVRLTEMNKLNKTVIESANKGGLQLFKQIETPIPGKTVSYRDGGVLKHYEVMNDDIYRALTTVPKAAIPVLNNMRQWMQSASTGTLATMTGQPFAPISMMYNGMVSSIVRPSGTATGLIDKGLQSVGFKPGLPGDPTWAVGAGYAIAADSAALISRGLSKSLNDSILQNGFIARTLGPHNVQKVADAAAKAWERSTLADLSSTGATANPHVTTLTNSMEEWERATSLLRTTNPDYASKVPFLDKAHYTLKAVTELIGNAAHSNYYRLNKGVVSDDVLTANTRNLTGDVSKRGGSDLMNTANSVIPYLNVSVQGTSRIIEAAVSQPLSTMVGVGVGVVLPTYLILNNALQQGDEYVKHLLVNRSSYEQAGKMPIYINGLPPEAAPTVPVTPEMRMPYVIALNLFSNMLGIDDGAVGAPEFGSTRQAINEMADNRDKDRLHEAFKSGIVPQVPGYIAAQEALSRPGRTALPGFERNNSMLTDDANGFVIQNILQSVAGSVGQAAVNFWQAQVAAQNGGAGVGMQLQRGREAIAQTAEDRQPYLRGLLWDSESKLSRDTADNRMLRQKFESLRNLIETARDLPAHGMTGPKGVPLEADIGPSKVDPSWQPIIGNLQPALTAIINGPGKEKQELERQLEGWRQDVRTGPEQKRIEMNRVTKEIDQVNRDMLGAIGDLEVKLGDLIGRPVKLQDIDVTKPIQ